MASTDPKTATQGQWEDLASRVQSKAEIGTVLSTPSSTVFVQTANIADGAITTDKIAGTAVTASNIDFSTLSGNYSYNEVDTGYTWVDGSHIYKKTIYKATVAAGTPTNIAHGISNIKHCIKYEAFEVAATNTTLILPALADTSGGNYASIWTVGSTNISVCCSLGLTDFYITLYYTKN